MKRLAEVPISEHKKLAADFGYTDGRRTLGHIENETFSADLVTILIKDFQLIRDLLRQMQHAVKIAQK